MLRCQGGGGSKGTRHNHRRVGDTEMLNGYQRMYTTITKARRERHHQLSRQARSKYLYWRSTHLYDSAIARGTLLSVTRCLLTLRNLISQHRFHYPHRIAAAQAVRFDCHLPRCQSIRRSELVRLDLGLWPLVTRRIRELVAVRSGEVVQDGGTTRTCGLLLANLNSTTRVVYTNRRDSPWG